MSEEEQKLSDKMYL